MIKGLSGGERKRTSIGVELITDPKILFCDEPTSGLDSFNAQKIVNVLNAEAKKGRIVIATIHQPSSEVYNSFDKLILMCEGNIIYQGSAAYAPRHFEESGFIIPRFSNPADYYMRVLSNGPHQE